VDSAGALQDADSGRAKATDGRRTTRAGTQGALRQVAGRAPRTHKARREEPLTGILGARVCGTNPVRMLRASVDDTRARSRRVGAAEEGCKERARLHQKDVAGLPPADDGVHHRVRCVGETLAVSEGQLVDQGREPVIAARTVRIAVLAATPIKVSRP